MTPGVQRGRSMMLGRLDGAEVMRLLDMMRRRLLMLLLLVVKMVVDGVRVVGMVGVVVVVVARRGRGRVGRADRRRRCRRRRVVHVEVLVLRGRHHRRLLRRDRGCSGCRRSPR